MEPRRDAGSSRDRNIGSRARTEGADGRGPGGALTDAPDLRGISPPCATATPFAAACSPSRSRSPLSPLAAARRVAAAVVKPIVFPVDGAVTYTDTFGACRDGCSRRHEGQDLMGKKMLPLVAAVDGVVHRVDVQQHLDGRQLRHDQGRRRMDVPLPARQQRHARAPTTARPPAPRRSPPNIVLGAIGASAAR